MANVPLFKVNMPPREALMPRLEEVLYSGSIGEGDEVKKFEKRFGDYIENPNVLTTSSGTAALHMALILAGIKKGDEVISTPMTAEPTNVAILHSGASVVWGDVDPDNGNISPSSIREKISPKTRAIMLVDYAGIPCELKEIREISEEHGIPIIEDAAHALGAKYDGAMVGTHSDYVIFSFQAIKHLTTVDGGMFACRKIDDCAKGRVVRWFGMDRSKSRMDMDIELVGYKYHMNNVTATIGQVQMDFISDKIKTHVDNGEYFDRELSGIDGIQLCKYPNSSEPSYWLYTLLVDRKDDFMKHMEKHEISCSPVHKRNDMNSIFSSSSANLPGMDEFYNNMVHIPCGWWVTEEDRERIVEAIKRGW